jgi:putative phosphoesterase
MSMAAFSRTRVTTITRLALISDIHGNYFALDAVLAEIARERVDHILCLGDLAVLGPQPGEVIDRLRTDGISCVCGNVDVWAAPGHPLPAGQPTSGPAIDMRAWTMTCLTGEQADFLRSLPMSLCIHAGAVSILGVHATPASLDDITHAGCATEAGEWGESAIVCCGHTHIQAVWRVDQQLWINPGSVGLPGAGPGTPGLPRNRDVAWAEYALLDIDGDRRDVSLRRLSLDIEAMWRVCQETGMPHQSWWRALWAS